MDIEMLPLIGIKVGGSEIAFSASREDVERLLGAPYSERGASIYYFNNELRFDFDKSGGIEFVELLGGIDGELRPQIYGLSAFETDADELYNVLAEKNKGEIADNENGYSYAFFNISVGIYRETIPDNVREMIEEAAGEGYPMSAEDINAEMRRARHWATIGIGNRGYYE